MLVGQMSVFWTAAVKRNTHGVWHPDTLLSLSK